MNGRLREQDVEPRLLLVHFIRDLGGLTGTKVGCDTSQCGACTVLVDGVAVKSCTCLAVQAYGCDVTTIEGLAPGDQLHPLQEAFWNKHGPQCGFCTPGMILAPHELLRTNPSPSSDEIRHALEGNFAAALATRTSCAPCVRRPSRRPEVHDEQPNLRVGHPAA